MSNEEKKLTKDTEKALDSLDVTIRISHLRSKVIDIQNKLDENLKAIDSGIENLVNTMNELKKIDSENPYEMQSYKEFMKRMYGIKEEDGKIVVEEDPYKKCNTADDIVKNIEKDLQSINQTSGNFNGNDTSNNPLDDISEKLNNINLVDPDEEETLINKMNERRNALK